MIRKVIATAIKVIILLWLLGWVITVGPRVAWADVTHLATHLYGWVHANVSAARGSAKAPSPS